MVLADPFTTGHAPFHVPAAGKPCSTFYKIFGDIHSGPPLIVIHGGPGSGHEYCLPFGRLWSLYKIPVVMYDGIGCGQSTHLREKVDDPSFWQMDLFADELQNLLSHLGVESAFHLLGHSFGGVVATQFAVRQPRGLRRLIIVGSLACGQLWVDGIWELMRQLSTESQDAINKAVQDDDFTTPAYESAMDEHVRTFLCRSDPWPPEELALDFKNQAEDPTVRRAVLGRSPFVFTGPLKTWDSRPFLPRINVPTFILNGEFDTAQDRPHVPFFELIPRVRWMTVAGASHMGHLDSMEMQEKYLKLVSEFIDAEPK